MRTTSARPASPATTCARTRTSARQPRQASGLPDLPHPRVRGGGIATEDAVDWSTGGKRGPDGKPLFIQDDHGHPIYSAEKGDFKYGENVRPTHQVVQRRGPSDRHHRQDRRQQDPELNCVEGSASDPNARIWPFKVMVGKQPYDPVNKTLGGQPRIRPGRHRVLGKLRLRQVDQGRCMDYAGLLSAASSASSRRA